MISVEYEYNLPNEFLVDHSQSMGKKRKTTYDGPEKIFLIVDNETNKEDFGPVTPEDLADGRPLPQGCRYIEVDCVTNPLICQLRGPVIDEMEDEIDESVIEFHPDSPDLAGYRRIRRPFPVTPKDVYDKYNLIIDSNDNITLRIKSVKDVLFGAGAFNRMPEGWLPDWPFVRAQRDRELLKTDGKISDDMPEALKQKWRDYRQLLRDLPAVMQANNVPAHIALLMFPDDPDNEILPQDDPYGGAPVSPT